MPRFGGSTKQEIRERKVTTWLLVIANVVILVPAIGFWISYGLRQGLGTDYWYDFVIKSWIQSGNGRVVMGILTIIFPVGDVIINYLVYKRIKINLAIEGIIVGIVLAGAGVWLALG